MEIDKISLENEKKANAEILKAGAIMLVAIVLASIYTIEQYYSARHSLACFIGFATGGLALLVGYFINKKLSDRYIKYKKYILVMIFLIVIGSSSLLYVQSLMTVPPIALVMIARYYDKKFTRIMSVVTIVFIFVSIIISMSRGFIVDLNAVALEPGQTITIPENSVWILDGLLKLDVPTAKIIEYFVLTIVVPYVIVYIALVACFRGIITSGNSMIEKSKEEAKSQAIVERDLSIATKLQSTMQPVNFDDYGLQDKVSVYGIMQAARQVGGDFYDFFKLDDNHLCFLIGDVSGKGVPAALFMMRAQTCLKDMAVMGIKPAEILEKANEILNDRNEEKYFVTIWIAILDVTTGELLYSNAGHNNPLIRRANGEFEYMECEVNFVTAMMPGMIYEPESTTLNPGDSVFLYTDGVTDNKNSAGEFYGEERLKATLNKYKEYTSRELIEAIQSNLMDFKEDADQFDDITMLTIQYLSKTVG